MGKRIINLIEEDVLNILNLIKDCIRFDRFRIEQNENRQDNDNFMLSYGLTKEKSKKILLGINVKDFCYADYNKNNKNEIVYIFASVCRLKGIVNVEVKVIVYTKFLLTKSKGMPMTIVISFHEAKYPVKYMFRETKKYE